MNFQQRWIDFGFGGDLGFGVSKTGLMRRWPTQITYFETALRHQRTDHPLAGDGAGDAEVEPHAVVGVVGGRAVLTVRIRGADQKKHRGTDWTPYPSTVPHLQRRPAQRTTKVN